MNGFIGLFFSALNKFRNGDFILMQQFVGFPMRIGFVMSIFFYFLYSKNQFICNIQNHFKKRPRESQQAFSNRYEHIHEELPLC